MIYYKGIVEKTIDGKRIFFKHDMAAIAAVGDLQNLGLNEIIADCMRSKLSTLAAFLYCGAERYYKTEKKEFVYTMDDAIGWLQDDKIGFAGTYKMVEDCFKSPEYKEKNVEATVSDGALKTQSDLQSSTVA